MPGLGITDHRSDITGKDEIRRIIAVEDENKGMFGMISCNDPECFIGKPANAFQFVLKQQSRIYGYNHVIFVGVQAVTDHERF
jgi:hypothetical protein